MPAPTYYSDMAALRAVAPVSNDAAQTQGFATPNDKGGGLWIGVTGASPGTYSHNGGTIIVPSAGNGSAAWLRDYQGDVYPEWFGFLSAANATDRTAALSAAIAVGRDVVLPAGNFSLNSFDLNVNLRGAGQASTSLSAATAGAYFIRIGGRIELRDLTATGSSLTDCVISLINSNGCKLTALTIENGKFDNVFFEATGNNSNSVISGCLIRICGRIYSTGTAAGSASGSTVTFTGSANLTSLEIDPKTDWLYLEDDAQTFAYEITAITSTTLSVYPPLSSTFAASTFEIARGSNVRIANNGDNSRIVIRECSLQDAKGAGIQDNALYGAISIANVIEYSGYGRVIGQRSAAQPTYDAQDIGVYYEVSKYRDSLYAYALGELVRIGGSGGSQSQAVFSGSYAPTVITCYTPVSEIPVTGVKFPASPIDNGDPNTIEAYAEGDWTPIDISGAGLTFSSVVARYQRIGRYVTVSGQLVYPTTSNAAPAVIGGLPFTQTYTWQGGVVTRNTSSTRITLAGTASTGFLVLTDPGAANVPNSALSGATLHFTSTYELFPT